MIFILISDSTVEDVLSAVIQPQAHIETVCSHEFLHSPVVMLDVNVPSAPLKASFIFID